MAKFSSAKNAPTRNASRAVIKTVSTTPDTVTYEGGPAYTRDSLSELFMLGVANFVGENTFYEKAGDRDDRFEMLSRTVAVSDPNWFADFVAWLRADGNMRSAPLTAAAQGVYARLQELRCATDGCGEYGMFIDKDEAGTRRCGAHKQTGAGESAISHKDIIASVLQRADEPGELVAYWEQRFGEPNGDGKFKVKLPKSLKRGIAKAMEGISEKEMREVYTEFSALKYDTAGKAKRFGDIVELVHPKPKDDVRREFYRWLIDRRHGRDGVNEYPLLPMVAARKSLAEIPQDSRRAYLGMMDSAELLKVAGVTWEWLATWLGGPLDAAFWEAVIPQMGYMALLRNLRNFDQAGISREASKKVAERLEDPRQVARSRQFPFRFWNAYKALDSVTYAPALEAALDLSTQNIPELGGRTLILVDTSGSMTDPITEKSSMMMVEAAALFGIALAKKGENVDLYGFASGLFSHRINKGTSVLKETARFVGRVGEVGHGTQITESVRATFNGHDRVVIFTDGQGSGGYRSYEGTVGDQVPDNVPVYAFTLNGYRQTMLPSKKNRYELGGLTDATFKQIKLLEAGAKGTWPWQE